MIRTLFFTETVAGATYTASVTVPAGARLLDVLVDTSVAWTAVTAPIDVGDSDASDALVNGFDMAAQGGTAAKSKGGTDWGDGLSGNNGPLSAVGPGKFYPNGDTITAVCSPTVPGGPTGVSSVSLLLEIPSTHRAAVAV